MKKNLPIILGVLVLGVVVLIGAAYAYALSQRDALVLKSNLKELTELTHVKSFDEQIVTTSNITVAGTEQTIPSTETLNIKVNVENDEATVTNVAGESTVINIESYKLQYAPVHEYSVWEGVINEGGFTAEDAEMDGVDVWKYTFNEEKTTGDYLSLLEPGMKAQVQLMMQAQGMEVSDLEFTYNGLLEIVIYVDKSNFHIMSATITAAEPMVISFNVAVADQVVPSMVTIADFQIAFEVSNFEVKGLAASLPTNVLVLWLGSMFL